ncbi:MAG: hypothetical protein RLZZ282_1380 [Verrucomicrobiota bacterium]|jgi:cytidylate kinase
MHLGNQDDKCRTFINCQLNPESKVPFAHAKLRPAVTVSRQTGAGAMVVAEELAEFFQRREPGSCRWMIFDKNLAEKVLEEHKLPKEIAQFMPEDRVSTIQDAVEEILGLHPSSRTLRQLTTETMQHLAGLGHVILIGRAANIITQQMPNVFHVRLVAPLDQRVQRVMTLRQLDHQAALRVVQQSDLGRARYLKNHFHSNIDDNLQYDLVINTGRIPHPEVARLIGDAVLHWLETL